MIFVVISINTKIYSIDLSNEIINQTGENFGISDFVKETDKYAEDFFEGQSISKILNSAISGKVDNSSIIKRVLKIFANEILKTIKTLVGVLVIVLIHSILKNVADGLENSDISNIIYFVQYILIISLVMNNFSDIVISVKNTINNLVGFMNTLIPILITLMIYTGSVVTSGLIQPIILFVVEFVANVLNTIILPAISIITALIIISKISDKVQIGKLASFMKSSIVWFLSIILTIFVGVVSLEGTLTSSVDGITAKTAKAAVSSLIPVVGKILGDSVDSVLGCGLILKNALGVVGVLVIIGICIIPIIKLTTLSIMYSLSSAIIEPLADKKIIKLLEEFSGIFKLLLAILCSVTVLLIIGVTLVVKISNGGMMYR